MSAFGKYGVGGSVPGKWPGAPNEATVDMTAATQGTETGNPDSKPEVGNHGAPEHNAAR